MYIGLEVISQAFLATPARYSLAVAISVLPSLAFLAALEANAVLSAVGANITQVTGDAGETLRALVVFSNGFIISALLWGAATSELLDRRFGRSATYLAIAALFCLFGLIHSSAPQGTFTLPWRTTSTLPLHFASGYLAAALIIAVSKYFSQSEDAL